MRDESDVMWNVRRGEDGTMIETIDPNTPAVKRLLCEELEKTKRQRWRGGRNFAHNDSTGQDITAPQAIERSGER